jgi:hypothetical protein
MTTTQFSCQAVLIEKHGGREAILQSEDLGYTLPP